MYLVQKVSSTTKPYKIPIKFIDSMNGNIQDMNTQEFSCILENTPAISNCYHAREFLLGQFGSLREDECEISCGEIEKYLFSLKSVYSKIHLFEKIHLQDVILD